MYTAVVIDGTGRAALVAALEGLGDLNGFEFRTPRGDPLPDHFTLNLGPFDPRLNAPSILGEPADITIDAFFIDVAAGACAARVSGATSGGLAVHSANPSPHVTMCLEPGTGPVASNSIGWGSVALRRPAALRVRGVVRECR